MHRFCSSYFVAPQISSIFFTAFLELDVIFEINCSSYSKSVDPFTDLFFFYLDSSFYFSGDVYVIEILGLTSEELRIGSN